jgi:hypothetical protein
MGQPMIVLQSQSHEGGAELLYVIPTLAFGPDRISNQPCAVFEYQRARVQIKGKCIHGNTNMMHLKLQSAA